MEYELKKSFSSVWNRLVSCENSADGAYDAGAYWCGAFEKPVGYGTWIDNTTLIYGETSIARGNLAKNTYWTEYSKYINLSDSLTDKRTKVRDYALSKVGTSYANGWCQAFVCSVMIQLIGDK